MIWFFEINLTRLDLSDKMQSLGAMIAILIIGLSLQFFNKIIELDLELGILISRGLRDY